MGLKAVVETPSMPGEEPELEEIELPPQDMWGQLNNAADEPAAAITPSIAAAPQEKTEVAQLQFLGERTRVVELVHPFVLDGAEVREITIRRLSVSQVNELLDRIETSRLVTMDIYAVMTGIPAAVLRGLDDDDGREVLARAYDFLPRSLRTDAD